MELAEATVMRGRLQAQSESAVSGTELIVLLLTCLSADLNQNLCTAVELTSYERP